jgi:cellobiose phosphorylase
VALETTLGFRLEGDRLRLELCIPTHWPGFEITYKYRSATYHVRVENPNGVERGVREVTVDGTARADGVIPLADDGRSHEVRVLLG